MLRALSRLALATAVPAAMALPATPAQAVTVPGCFGAVVVVCDITATVALPGLVETYEVTVPVCAGTCLDVPVTLVRSAPGDPGSVCVSYENRDGAVVYTNCRTIPTIPDIPDVNVNDLLDEVSETLNDAIWNVLCRLEPFEDNIQCW